MDAQKRKELVSQFTVLAFIIALVLFIASGFLDLIVNNNISFTLKGFAWLFMHNPIHWFLLVLVFILPAATYLITSYFTSQLIEKQKIINFEQNRTFNINRFTQQLIHDDFSVEYELAGEDDVLGKSLINLRDTLKKNKESDQNRRKEEEQRNWIAEGMAHFSEILRNNVHNLEQLSYAIIKDLTKYNNAILGGIYMLNDADEKNRFFDLTAFFAYDRRKFADQKIAWGDGLIGTCALEQKTIHISNVPENYIKVTSGLGQANPRCVLIVPMLRENEIHGVLEFASFKLFEQHQINLIEKVAESIASTLSAVKTNVKTSKLLEESKAQAQALASQEEEMRQNLEELQATQEEVTRQSERFLLLENTVNHTMIRAEYSLDGTLLYANTRFLNKLEYVSNSDVEGQHISMFIGEKDREWFNKIWHQLSHGGRHYEGYMKHITRTGKDLWTLATYTCVRHEDSRVDKILFLALDTTEHKKISLRMEGIIDAVDRIGIKLETDVNGNIVDSNEGFSNVFKFSQKDLGSLTLFDIVDTMELEGFNKRWDTIIKGMGYFGQIKAKTKNNEEKWIRGAFSAVYDMYHEVERIIFIGHDVTNEKQMEIELRNQTDILKKQEKMLRESEKELSRKLREAKVEMQNQFKEIEHIKIRNERTLEGALDAIITTSHDNRIIFFNHAAENLWGHTKNEVINQNVGILFSDKVIEEDDFLARYTGPGDQKIVGVRKEIKIVDKSGVEKPVLILLSKAQVDNENTYTAFIQNIEVELF